MSITKLRAEMIARKSYSSEKRKRRLRARNVSIIGVGYRYDCFDRRISKTVDTDPANVAVNSSPTTFYVYDGVNVRMEFTKPDGIAGGAPAALSVRYFNGQGVDNVLAQENYSPQAVPGQIGSTYWLIKDQVGSTTDVLNANGQQVNHIDYTTFGQFQILDPNTGTYTLSSIQPAGTVTSHLFTGREFDTETGDYYYRARNYDNAIGRFQSEDPLGMLAGSNQYTYVSNNPINRIDSTGLAPGDPFDTPVAAARDVLRGINPVSIEKNREHSGFIYYDPAKNAFYATQPTCGGSNRSIPRTGIPKGTILVGAYHTHGAYTRKILFFLTVRTNSFRDTSGADYLSPDDMEFNSFLYTDRKNYFRGYVATPGGELLIDEPSLRGIGAPFGPYMGGEGDPRSITRTKL